MARFQVSTTAAEPVRPYLEGVAKSLVDRLYGADSPVWGTRLTAIEDTVKAVRQVLSEKMLAEALQRQADTVGHEPADLHRCPKCGKEVKRKPDQDGSRILQTDVGEAHWQEPVAYCRTCRRSFFPQTRSWGIDQTEYSPTLQRKITRAGTQSRSFAHGSKDLLAYREFAVDPKQVERITEGIGAARCVQRDAEVKAYLSLPLVERKGKPAGGDGSGGGGRRRGPLADPPDG